MVVSFIIYYVPFLPSPLQCVFRNRLIQFILLWHKVKAACDKQQTFSIFVTGVSWFLSSGSWRLAQHVSWSIYNWEGNSRCGGICVPGLERSQASDSLSGSGGGLNPTVWQTQLGGGHLNPCQTSKRQAPMNNSTTKLFGGTAHMACFITWPFLQTNTHLLWLSKVCEYCFNV